MEEKDYIYLIGRQQIELYEKNIYVKQLQEQYNKVSDENKGFRVQHSLILAKERAQELAKESVSLLTVQLKQKDDIIKDLDGQLKKYESIKYHGKTMAQNGVSNK